MVNAARVVVTPPQTPPPDGGSLWVDLSNRLKGAEPSAIITELDRALRVASVQEISDWGKEFALGLSHARRYRSVRAQLVEVFCGISGHFERGLFQADSANQCVRAFEAALLAGDPEQSETIHQNVGLNILESALYIPTAASHVAFSLNKAFRQGGNYGSQAAIALEAALNSGNEVARLAVVRCRLSELTRARSCSAAGQDREAVKRVVLDNIEVFSDELADWETSASAMTSLAQLYAVLGPEERPLVEGLLARATGDPEKATRICRWCFMGAGAPDLKKAVESSIEQEIGAASPELLAACAKGFYIGFDKWPAAKLALAKRCKSHFEDGLFNEVSAYDCSIVLELIGDADRNDLYARWKTEARPQAVVEVCKLVEDLKHDSDHPRTDFCHSQQDLLVRTFWDRFSEIEQMFDRSQQIADAATAAVCVARHHLATGDRARAQVALSPITYKIKQWGLESDELLRINHDKVRLAGRWVRSTKDNGLDTPQKERLLLPELVGRNLEAMSILETAVPESTSSLRRLFFHNCFERYPEEAMLKQLELWATRAVPKSIRILPVIVGSEDFNGAISKVKRVLRRAKEALPPDVEFGIIEADNMDAVVRGVARLSLMGEILPEAYVHTHGTPGHGLFFSNHPNGVVTRAAIDRHEEEFGRFFDRYFGSKEGSDGVMRFAGCESGRVGGVLNRLAGIVPTDLRLAGQSESSSLTEVNFDFKSRSEVIPAAFSGSFTMIYDGHGKPNVGKEE